MGPLRRRENGIRGISCPNSGFPHEFSREPNGYVVKPAFHGPAGTCLSREIVCP